MTVSLFEDLFVMRAVGEVMPDTREIYGRLRPYQREGVAFLGSHQSALLGDEMGMGKTVQAGVAISTLLDTNKLRKVLVVAPTALTTNWQRELRTWSPRASTRIVVGDRVDRRMTYRLPVNVTIASYPQIRLDIQGMLSDQVKWDLVILDEAQWIKNRNSETHLACRLLRTEWAWALSATPLENHADDFGAIINFLSPSALTPGASRSEIHKIAATLFLRRVKRDVLPELPSIIDQELPITLAPAQREAYEGLAASGRRRLGGGGDSAGMLALITELKLLCNFDPASGQSAKLDALRSIADSIHSEGGKLLVFSQYVKTLQAVTQELPLEAEVYHGGLNAEARDGMLGRFKNGAGPRALLVSLRAGGVGLNLPEASHVVLFDRWWNPAVENQAIQRAHRFGRELPLHVIRFLCVDTVEERIVEVLRQKADIFADVVEGAPSAEHRTDVLERILGLTRERE